MDANAEYIDDYTTDEINPVTGLPGAGTRVSFLYRYIPNNTSTATWSLSRRTSVPT
ncbi:MAG TPA: hypothetical protein VK902_03275 [Rubrobacter sp.]|nr:hypothetical protein [Rubrobacter sp.]